jgi:hypothetical protein
MSTVDVIGELLRASLLGDLGDDPDRAGRLRLAAEDLAQQLRTTNRQMVPSCVLAAVDQTSSHESGALIIVTDAVLGRWETFHNAFATTPTELLRAVALAGVAGAISADDDLRSACWYTARTAMETVNLGRWSDVVQQLWGEWDGAVADQIDAVWSPPVATSVLRMPKVAAVQSSSVSRTLVERAQTLAESPNYSTFATSLMPEFPRYIEGLLAATEAVSAEDQKSLHSAFKEFSSGLGSRIRQALAAHDATVEAMRLRNALLWWRQTAFSEVSNKPYRELAGPAHIALAAALDLHHQIPAVAPVAVEHLLADLVAAASDNAEVDLAALRAAASADLPGITLASPSLLLDSVAGAVPSPVLGDTSKLAASHVAVLLLRDLQARRLAATAPPVAPEPAADSAQPSVPDA